MPELDYRNATNRQVYSRIKRRYVVAIRYVSCFQDGTRVLLSSLTHSRAVSQPLRKNLHRLLRPVNANFFF